MFDGMVQRRDAVNHNSAAYEEHRQRAHHRQALHQRGASTSRLLPMPLATALDFSSSQ